MVVVLALPHASEAPDRRSRCIFERLVNLEQSGRELARPYGILRIQTHGM
jgi:hypothetical protein